MDFSTIYFYGGVFSIFVASAVVFLAYELYRHFRYQRSNIGWLAIAIATAMMLLRSILYLASAAGVKSGALETFFLYDWIFSAASSVVLLYAFWKLRKGFEEERQVEEETMMRIRAFEAQRKDKLDSRRARGKKAARARKFLEDREGD
jgi:hypothetical protein